MNNKLISSILVSAVLAGTFTAANVLGADNDDVTVLYNNEKIDFDVLPEIENGRTMVPMRKIFEAVGAKVRWDGETQTVTAKKKSKTITMTIGSADMQKNDETYTFDAAPEIKDGRTLVPVRAISELLGLDVDWNENTKTVSITDKPDDESWNENIGSINLTSKEVSGEGVNVSGGRITVSKGGDFTVTGEISDGMIYVDTEDEVRLRLSGASITNSQGPAIFVNNSEKLNITLEDNTVNTLCDGSQYSSEFEGETGCISSKDDIKVKGGGTLLINAKKQNGIKCGDSISITEGNITIAAPGDGINANETVAISGGELNITASGDGIQADEIIDITDGSISITTDGDITDETVSSKGIKSGWISDISGGSININSTDHAFHSNGEINISGGEMTLLSQSKKGIAGDDDISISGGDIKIEKSTEGIEGKAIIKISGGSIDITSSDDGINAGGTGADGIGGRGGGMIPGFQQGMMPGEHPEITSGGQMPNSGEQMPNNGGQMNMPRGERPQNTEFTNNSQPNTNQGKRPEFWEGAQMPDIENQMNIPQGERPQGGMGNRNSTEISAEHHIDISGGKIYINSRCDGIDSNGSLVISGGEVYIDGPEQGGDSALDTDGLMRIDGGNVIAVGIAGMLELPGELSTQHCISYTFETTESGNTISIKDTDGNTIMEYSPSKSYQNIIYSSADIKTGSEYGIYLNDTLKETVKCESVITSGGASADRGAFGKTGTKGNRQNPAPTPEVNELN